MNRYQVVKFANGKYGVYDKVDNEYMARRNCLSRRLNYISSWWLHPSNVAERCTMSEQLAMAECKQLLKEEGRKKELRLAEKEKQAGVNVVETIECSV